jgi:hypothetical protein
MFPCEYSFFGGEDAFCPRENACGYQNIAYALCNTLFSEENIVAAEENMQYSPKNGHHSGENNICGSITRSKSTSYIAMKRKLYAKAIG